MTNSSEKKPNAGVLKYATSVSRATLGEDMPQVELREHGEITISYYAGSPFAAYWFEGSEIVFRFRRPNNDALRAEQAKYFHELSTPKDWLEYRRPLSRDPRPSLESKSGQIMGTAFYEISQGQLALVDVSVEEITTPRSPTVVATVSGSVSVTSGGGPYIALPQSQLAAYPGYSDEKLNERIFMTASEEGNLAKLAMGTALLLGTPDTLYWFPKESGGVLVRISYFEQADDALLAQLIAELDDEDWNDIEGTLKVTEPWIIFDAAVEGSSAAMEGLKLDLTSGTYALSSRTLHSEDFEFLLVRILKV